VVTTVRNQAKEPRDVDFFKRRKWLLIVLWVCAGLITSWSHWWTAPGMTTVTGAIVYWMTYTGTVMVAVAALVMGLFYAGRSVSRGIKRLLSR
jgi:hypothetical protein